MPQFKNGLNQKKFMDSWVQVIIGNLFWLFIRSNSLKELNSTTKKLVKRKPKNVILADYKSFWNFISS